ncbi:hypothetical protein EDEG_02215 [Edhazardia aedis USNM 41457]|uniref:Uncharacterized protein n=1 Tax=Edhazardia aedis (strain USNM 41457) TaxID=1003232 RepID=J9DLI3_EDHAE|nr:hypothetical protein EDEG_02215 [Edhazardia aedis USNM 41457]|eukprot:EJW03450.1 hypothetical protein EDEG_02215 [Edhazardia aedis USNM 41457]
MIFCKSFKIINISYKLTHIKHFTMNFICILIILFINFLRNTECTVTNSGPRLSEIKELKDQIEICEYLLNSASLHESVFRRIDQDIKNLHVLINNGGQEKNKSEEILLERIAVLEQSKKEKKDTIASLQAEISLLEDRIRAAEAALTEF